MTEKKQRVFYAKIACPTRDERDAIERALNDKVAHCAIVIIGTLLPLKKREQQRIMNYMQDRVDDPDGFPALP